MRQELINIENELSQEDLWKNPEAMKVLGKKEQLIKEKLYNFNKMEQAIESAALMFLDETVISDPEFLQILYQDTNDALVIEKEYRLLALMSGPHDDKDCFLEIHAGSGGTEAHDWAQMLQKMYVAWFRKMKYNFSLIDETMGLEAGIKSVTYSIKAEGNAQFPYGWLKCETGTHRLVRISPFDANSKRHTSFAGVSVYPEMPASQNIIINEEDLRIETYRASGAGGQHVNKTDSAVRITHKPTGIVASSQSDRSQHRNKDTAMRMVLSQLTQRMLLQEQATLDNIRGEKSDMSFGTQIRSYVMNPYQKIKDTRSGYENSKTDMSAECLQEFLVSMLEYRSGS